MRPYSTGNPHEKLWFVADFLTPHDVKGQEIGSGYPWRHLHSLLAQAGIHDYYFTYLSEYPRPSNKWATKTTGRKKKLPLINSKYVNDPRLPKELSTFEGMLAKYQPHIVVTMGDLSLWALTGHDSSAKYRGSQLTAKDFKCKVIPLQDPIMLDKQWSWRVPMRTDLRRLARHIPLGSDLIPDHTNYRIWPTYTEALEYLTGLLWLAESEQVRCAIDIETRGGSIFCMGFCYDIGEAICVPFHSRERPDLYTEDEHLSLRLLIKQVLEHPNIIKVGQNFNYDRTYIFEELLCWAYPIFDTMTAQHIMFPGQPKGLDYLSSLYCLTHVYWKDERKESVEKNSESIEFRYNTKDAKATLEVHYAQIPLLEQLGQTENYKEFLKVSEPLLLLQVDGVRIDQDERTRLHTELSKAESQLLREIHTLAGRELNPRSPPQMKEFFYDDCRIKPYKSRSTGQSTLSDYHVGQIGKRYPLLSPLCERIRTIRTFGVLRSNTVDAHLWRTDRRMHCSYNATGTTTFRLSSSKCPYGTGCNNQNITEGKAGINLRRMFKPEPGYQWISMDLDRADLQIVARESGAPILIEQLDAGEDVWSNEAAVMLGKPVSALTKQERHDMKQRLHATNYGGSARTVAIQFGRTISEIEQMQQKWFQRHPQIAEWHDQIEMEMMSGVLTNIFGYQWRIFDHMTGHTLNQALAWKPQSTVAIVCHKMMLALYERFKDRRDIFRFTLQLHDELGFQIREDVMDTLLPEIKELCRIQIPYDPPLVIPVGFKAGPNWGDVKEIEV